MDVSRTLAAHQALPKDMDPLELRGHRTLATVVFTDCVGFSARMSADEDRTLDLIQRDLEQMQHICTQYEGKVLKSTGDGLLMYFLSAVKAVECAVEIQASLAAAQHPIPTDQLQHRIGIHLADLFITATDVMGNGVNIAARLQSEADPGGICFSQTVYDVIKTSLHLDIVSLGLRRLKNIREAIATYKILLRPEPDQARLFTNVLSGLERDSALPRIKKLLYYACYNYWETDAHRLESLNLAELIQETLKQAPSPAKLEYFLSKAANTLSKPIEYTQVAHLIVLEVGKLCPHQPHPDPSDASTTPLSDGAGAPHDLDPTEPPIGYMPVVKALQQNSQFPRLHKLLFYVCQNRWESDPVRLRPVSFLDLVVTLHGRSPTLHHLQATVQRFVQTLSKPDEYQAIAWAIVTAYAPLYAQSHPETTAPYQAPPAPPDAATITHPQLPSPQLDLCNFRLELMKYTTPLQSKILIFSALHTPFQFTRQDWADLKQHTLTGLLHHLFDTCKAYTDLEFLLYSTARRLVNAEAAVQTATDVIKCLRPFYLYGGTRLAKPGQPGAATIIVTDLPSDRLTAAPDQIGGPVEMDATQLLDPST